MTTQPVPRLLPYWSAAAAGAAGIVVECLGSVRALRSYQTARVRALLRHSYETVPFYRERFERAGFRPDQFRTLEDLKHVPILQKSDLRVATDDETIASDCDRSRLHCFTTGGSTGEPMKLRFTAFEDRLLRTFRLLANMRQGLRPRDRRTQVRTDAQVPSRINESFILPSQVVYAFQPQEQMRANLCQFGPDVVRGFPSVLASFADKITDEDRLRLKPRFVNTDSENLTDLARQKIEHAFKAPVYDVYDCYECNVIAYQCPRGAGYHVMDPSVVVEVIHEGRPAQPGESGEIVLTSLHAWAAPLIRYAPGDMAERGPERCACGAACSTLSKVHGRTHDVFQLPGGGTVHPKYIMGPLRPIISSLYLYQVVQEAIDRVAVRLQLMPGAEMSPETLETVRKGFSRHLGEGITVVVSVVGEIPCEPNGKFRPYRSYVTAGAAV